MDISQVYSPLKILHHYPRLQEMKDGGHPAPILVQLILSDFCSHSCQFCSYRLEGYTSNQLFGILKADGTVNNNPKRMIPYEKAREILTDCQGMGVKAIEFTGGGESTVHPDFCDIVDWTNSLGLDYSLVTHGGHLKQKLRESLRNATWIRVSLDAGSDETYSEVRRIPRGSFQKTLHNFDALVSERTRKDQVLGISFVVTKENWREIITAAEIAKDLGADYFRIGAFFSQYEEQYYEGIYEHVQEMCEEAALLTTPTFRVFNQFKGRISDLVQKSPSYKTCGHMQFNTYIGGDLSVYRCCALAYNDRGYLGSLKDQSFSSLWNSQSVRDDFANFDARSCDRCPFNDKNKVMNYLLEENPPHRNFV